MDKSKAIQSVKRLRPRLVAGMGLGDMRLQFNFEREENDQQAGTCTNYPDYSTAVINFDPAGIKDEAELESVLRHELQHAVLAPFCAYRAISTTGQAGGSPEDKQEQAIFSHFVEQGVLALERMWQGSRAYWRAEFARESKARKPKRKARR